MTTQSNPEDLEHLEVDFIDYNEKLGGIHRT